MTTLNQEIRYFLRDAQYRIAELGNQINLEYQSSDEKTDYLKGLREQLYAFTTVLFVNVLTFKDDNINYLDWEDREILAEIHYLRSISGMSEIPALDFTAYNPEVLNVTGLQTSSVGLIGEEKQVYSWDIRGIPVAATINPIAGMGNKTITQFFGL